jgi:hypothetical protein
LEFRRAIFSILFLVVMSIAFFSVPIVVQAQKSNAESAISNVHSELVQCFDAAKAAEYSGANISRLTAILNSAGLLLSQAEGAYSVGDMVSALSFANQSHAALNGFISEASSLKSAGEDSSNLQNLVFVGSIVGTFAVIGGSFAVWRLLKRKYDDEGGVQKN